MFKIVMFRNKGERYYLVRQISTWFIFFVYLGFYENVILEKFFRLFFLFLGCCCLVF